MALTNPIPKRNASPAATASPRLCSHTSLSKTIKHNGHGPNHLQQLPKNHHNSNALSKTMQTIITANCRVSHDASAPRRALQRPNSCVGPGRLRRLGRMRMRSRLRCLVVPCLPLDFLPWAFDCTVLMWLTWLLRHCFTCEQARGYVAGCYWLCFFPP